MSNRRKLFLWICPVSDKRTKIILTGGTFEDYGIHYSVYAGLCHYETINGNLYPFDPESRTQAVAHVEDRGCYTKGGVGIHSPTFSIEKHERISSLSINQYVYIYNMRIKKSDKYTTEREDIINRALEILQLDEDKSFILYEFDKDIEKQNRIIELAIDIKRYFASSYWNGINDKNTVRPYLTIIRNLFKNQGFLFINKSFIYNTGENGKVKTTRYYIIKKE